MAAVGLSLLFMLPGADDLNRGLAFRPVGNVLGGLIIGAGMVVASSCVSGLFYKLGSGMLGALVGLAGWGTGELIARQFTISGPTILAGGESATIPALLGLPRLMVAVLVLAVVCVILWRGPGKDHPEHSWQWGWRPLGISLGLVITAGWALAAVGGSSFGPSTTGVFNSVANGSSNYWLIAFVLGIYVGGFIAARSVGGFQVRGERGVRYLQLGAGGVLLGAGGWIAGGCNVGHGLSGVAQLNVSSLVVVAAMVGGVALTRRVSPQYRPNSLGGQSRKTASRLES